MSKANVNFRKTKLPPLHRTNVLIKSKQEVEQMFSTGRAFGETDSKSEIFLVENSLWLCERGKWNGKDYIPYRCEFSLLKLGGCIPYEDFRKYHGFTGDSFGGCW